MPATRPPRGRRRRARARTSPPVPPSAPRSRRRPDRRRSGPRRRPSPTTSIGSADASTIRSHEPKTSRCATPTFVTIAMSGRAIPHRIATSPTRRAPISATTTSVSAARSEQRHRQPDLVVERLRARVRPEPRPEHGGRHVLRGGLAVGPGDGDDVRVHRAIARPRRASSAPRRSIARTPPDRRRRDRRAPAPPRRRSRTPPARTARRRSVRRGARRTARPATTSRESIATDDTSTSVPRKSPSTARATSDIRRGFTRRSPRPRAPRARRRDRRTG